MSSTWGLEILDTLRSTLSAMVALSWVLPCASTARAVAMTILAIPTSLALTEGRASSRTLPPLRIESRICCV